ncbi:Two-component response regulator [Lachnospiraceae bacterium TWA4]|nr:Two-component response regulator [Lachnospiraceae bacterium TWA4]
MDKILIVEDDATLVRMLSAFMIEEGYEVQSTFGQRKARELMNQYTFDLALVDISLSDGTGYGVYNDAKEKNLPVIFLTASGDEHSVVTGLDMGAYDYITKPFRPRELVSRVKNVLRRTGKQNSVIKIQELEIDSQKGAVYKNGKEIEVSAMEYRLLLVLAANKGQILSRNQLLGKLWDGVGNYVNDNTLTVYIKRLREKIEDDPAHPVYIKTLRGLGYRMEE